MHINDKILCSKCLRETGEDGVCPHCGYEGNACDRDSRILEEGTILNGRYLLGASIGMGGFGITYAAWDLQLDNECVIKEYYPNDYVSRDTDESDEITVNPDSKNSFAYGMDRFICEARVMAMLHDVPGMASVKECFTENNSAYISMEFIHGVTVDKYKQEKDYSPRKLIELMRQPIDLLSDIHKQGILHRDIKPSNLLITADRQIKLIDFGAAVQTDKENKSVIFTEHFSAPEQYDAKAAQGPWTDVYGMAATLYYLITGEFPPVPGTGTPTLSARKYGLKRWEADAILKGLQPDGNKRPRSMEEFRALLYHLRMPEEIIRLRRITRTLVAVFAIILLLINGVAVNSIYGLPFSGGRYTLGFDGAVLRKGAVSSGSAVIPEQVLGITVTEIGSDAFQSLADLKTVVIPETVKTVSSSAFNDCPSLSDVTVSSAQTAIAPSAFTGCNGKLVIYTQHGSQTEQDALKAGIDCVDLSDYEWKTTDNEITITGYTGDSLRMVVPHYINGLPVTRIEYPEWKEDDNSAAQYKLASAGMTLVVPDEVAYIDISSFSFDAPNYCGFEAVEWGSGLKEIASFVCQGTELRIPESVDKINKLTFQGEKLTLPDGISEVNAIIGEHLTEISFPASLKTLTDSLMSVQTNLANIQFKQGLETIEKNAFSDCASLKSVYLPEGLKTIDDAAFYCCNSLTAIYIPESVESIGVMAFDGCSDLLTICGHAGSYAETYAKAHGINFDNVDGWAKCEYDLYSDSVTISGYYVNGQEAVILPSFIEGLPVKNLKGISCTADADVTSNYSLTLPSTLEYINTGKSQAAWHISSICIRSVLLSVKDYPPTTQALPELNYTNKDETLAQLSAVDKWNSWLFTNIGAVETTYNITLPDTVTYATQIMNRIKGHNYWVNIENCTHINGYPFYGQTVTAVRLGSEYEALDRYLFLGCKSVKAVFVYNRSMTFDGTPDDIFSSCEIKPIIYGFEDSTAEKYCEKYGLQFYILE